MAENVCIVTNPLSATYGCSERVTIVGPAGDSVLMMVGLDGGAKLIGSCFRETRGGPAPPDKKLIAPAR